MTKICFVQMTHTDHSCDEKVSILYTPHHYTDWAVDEKTDIDQERIIHVGTYLLTNMSDHCHVLFEKKNTVATMY